MPTDLMLERGYKYFDHDADIGLIAHGHTLEEAFEAAAEGMFAVMVEPSALTETTCITFSFEEADVELALVTWLNQLLAVARTHHLAPKRFRVQRVNSTWQGEAWGEPWRDNLPLGTEVKGATLTMLHATPVDGGWEASCVVDV